MTNEVFAEVDLETYRTMKYNDYNYRFLPVSDYPVIDIAKNNEIGRIGNVRFILRTDLTNMRSGLNYFINQLHDQLGNNVAARIILDDLIKHVNSVIGKE